MMASLWLIQVLLHSLGLFVLSSAGFVVPKGICIADNTRKYDFLSSRLSSVNGKIQPQSEVSEDIQLQQQEIAMEEFQRSVVGTGEIKDNRVPIVNNDKPDPSLVSEALSVIDGLQKVIQQKDEALASTENKYNEKIKALQVDLDNEKDTVGELREVIHEQSKALEKLTSAIDKLRMNENELIGKISDLETQMNDMNSGNSVDSKKSWFNLDKSEPAQKMEKDQRDQQRELNFDQKLAEVQSRVTRLRELAEKREAESAALEKKSQQEEEERVKKEAKIAAEHERKQLEKIEMERIAAAAALEEEKKKAEIEKKRLEKIEAERIAAAAALEEEKKKAELERKRFEAEAEAATRQAKIAEEKKIERQKQEEAKKEKERMLRQEKEAKAAAAAAEEKAKKIKETTGEPKQGLSESIISKLKEAVESAKKAEEEVRRLKEATVAAKKAEKQQNKGQTLIPEVNDWKINEKGELEGTISNHPDIDDGDTIRTSPLSNPKTAMPQKVVVTKSGSKYKLGQSFKEPPLKKEIRVPQPKMNKPKLEFSLTGETVGNGKYLLAGTPHKSTTFRSHIYTAYRANAQGLPLKEQPPVAIKVSENKEAMERENANYRLLTTQGMFANKGMFATRMDFLPVADDSKKFAGKCALVMERGHEDVKAYFQRTRGGLESRPLREAAVSVASCIKAIHSAGLVWTDLKTDNFIVMTDTRNDPFLDEPFQIKGIDLESARPAKQNPVDYTPEACPPEFAAAFLNGDGAEFVLEKSYDIWSLGMVLYEMSTGQGYFDGKTPMQITRLLSGMHGEDKVSISDDIDDPKLRDLVSSCLQLNPKRRPSIEQVFLHPFFLTTGDGPLSFLQL